MWIPPIKSSNVFLNLSCPFHPYSLSQASPSWIPLSSMTVFLLFYVPSLPITCLNHWSTWVHSPLFLIVSHFFPNYHGSVFQITPQNPRGFPLKSFPHYIKCLRGEGMRSRSSWTSESLFSLLPTRPGGLLSVFLMFQWDWLNISVAKVWKLGLVFFRLAFSLTPIYLSDLTSCHILKGTSPTVPKVHGALQCSCPQMVFLTAQSVHLSPLCLLESICLPWFHSNIVTSAKPFMIPVWEILFLLSVSISFSNISIPFYTVL